MTQPDGAPDRAAATPAATPSWTRRAPEPGSRPLAEPEPVGGDDLAAATPVADLDLVSAELGPTAELGLYLFVSGFIALLFSIFGLCTIALRRR